MTTNPARTSQLHRATELECQRTIIDAALYAGWLVHAEMPAVRQSGRWATPIDGTPGFPDLVLARGHDLLALELKRRPNQLTDDQRRWGTALAAARIDYRVVWVPDELDAIIAELTQPPRPIMRRGPQ